MKRSTSRIAVTVTAAAALTALLPASQAAAINQTDCGDRTDFVKVWYDGGARTMCFANGGTVTLQLPNVSKVTSGDNNVAMFLGARAVTMNKWSTLVDAEGLNATLHALQIY
ncbi:MULTISPECIES: beta/gamma crystallin domain-containing protein [Streptomyces]|uniref:beta/gamma crystallin domain-containing protein n=1 Tax=Streptomyces TaxID=1883 RepID=UPI000A1FE8FD|nr:MULTISPECIES: beta/gamma crystallin domain-containing protein [Streptomyces]OSP39103.1 hypothetical protein B7767_33595 [Streptomyces sp. 13-12-16]